MPKISRYFRYDYLRKANNSDLQQIEKQFQTAPQYPHPMTNHVTLLHAPPILPRLEKSKTSQTNLLIITGKDRLYIERKRTRWVDCSWSPMRMAI